MEKLALFDIDLTLINTGGCGKRAMTLAFQKITGQTNGLDKVSFAGRTDPAIFREALQALKIEWQQSFQDEFQDLYIEILRDEINKPDKRKYIKPGILELLSVLQVRPDVTLALLTGNWYEGAKIKL